MAEDTIADGMVVGLTYQLTVDNEVVDWADASDPLEYLHGALNIVPGLEKALEGRRVGDKFDVTVSPEDGYGAYDPEEIEWVDRDELSDETEIEPGMVLTLEDDEGDFYDVVVAEVGEDQVALDFNPPLAGKTLYFHVEVVSLRPADTEELAHGHPHGYEDEDEDDLDLDEDDDLDDDDDDIDEEVDDDEIDEDNGFHDPKR